MRSGRPVDFELSLATDFIDRGLVGQLADELIGLDINVLFTWGCLGSLNITSEEFFSGLGPLLFETLRVVLSLVGLEELIRVSSCRNNHGGVGASAEDTLVIGDVLRVVLLGSCSTIRILILLFLSNDAGMGSEALASSST